MTTNVQLAESRHVNNITIKACTKMCLVGGKGVWKDWLVHPLWHQDCYLCVLNITNSFCSAKFTNISTILTLQEFWKNFNCFWKLLHGQKAFQKRNALWVTTQLTTLCQLSPLMVAIPHLQQKQQMLARQEPNWFFALKYNLPSWAASQSAISRLPSVGLTQY